MTVLRAGGAVILILLGVLVVWMNWWCVRASTRNKRRGIDKHHSTVPVVSFIFTGVLAYPLFPYEPKWWISIIPAFDIGNWMLIIGLPWVITQGMMKKDKPPSRSADDTG